MRKHVDDVETIPTIWTHFPQLEMDSTFPQYRLDDLFLDSFLNPKTPKVCVDQIQTATTQKVCVDEIQTSAAWNICVDNIRTGV